MSVGTLSAVTGLQAKHWIAFAYVGFLGACSVGPEPAAIHDPYEDFNRGVHEFNKQVDTNLLRPLGQAVARIPPELTVLVVNFSDNLSLPGMVVNNLLQADFEGAAINSGRFLLNSTLGVGGLLDPGSEVGLYEESTDFGETLHVWGVPEGAYVELPFFGPSTERDAVGMVVDFMLDPLESIGVPQEIRRLKLPSYAGEIIVERGLFAQTIDGLLYESADSYAQSRLAFMENRRYELGLPAPLLDIMCGDAMADPMLDPFADPFAAAPIDDTCAKTESVQEGATHEEAEQ